MRKIFKDIRDTLTHAKLCHEAWWILIEKNPNRKKLTNIYYRYEYFFETIRPALYCTFIIRLASVFGTRSDEISLNKIPKIINYPEFKNIWDKGRILHKYRSEIIAHRNKNISSEVAAKNTGFTYSNLKKILNDTCLLFNKVAEDNNTERISDFSCSEDLNKLIDDLYTFKINKLLPNA